MLEAHAHKFGLRQLLTAIKPPIAEVRFGSTVLITVHLLIRQC